MKKKLPVVRRQLPAKGTASELTGNWQLATGN
jgi:hypothetical protein